MAGGEKAWTDERVELIVARLLRLGVLLAAFVVSLGGLVYLARHGHQQPHYGVFLGEPSDLRTLGGIARDTAALSGRGIIQLGLLLLMATPVARVAFSVAAFALQRDKLYVVVTLIVLSLLLLSLSGHAP